MQNISKIYLILLTIAMFSTACDGFFGKKIDKDFLDVPTYNDRTVAYVPILPVMTGFSAPVDVIAGWDELIYVADSGTQEIISFNQAGVEMGRFKVNGLKAIAQTRSLDILALGRKDTTIGGTAFSLPAIYRIHPFKGDTVSLTAAKITHINIHPFCFNPSATPTVTDEKVQFTSVAILADNRYYVSCKGVGTAGSTQGDRVVLFNYDDKFQSPIFVSSAVGTYSDYFRSPQAIATFVQPDPRQTPNVSKSGDFFFTSNNPSFVLKTQGIALKESDNGSSYEVKDFPAGDTSKASSFLYNPYRFSNPTDISIAGDGTGYIFVVDAEKDSLFQFNGKGYEGVNPPPGSSSSKAIFASFGGRGSGVSQFNHPMGVCYQNKIVYVADAGNKRILRFKLTTDFR